MLGIIGGLGPKATAQLYLRLTERLATRGSSDLPELLIHSVPMTRRIENAFLRGQVDPRAPELVQTRAMLTDAVVRLVGGGARRIIMPCNTLQGELRRICAEREVGHLDMVDATCEAVVDSGVRRPLVLATTTTCRSDIYGARLRQCGVECRYPDEAVQELVEAHIRGALDLQRQPRGHELIDILRASTCDGVVIACTDISTELVARFEGAVFDSLDCLAMQASRWIAHGVPEVAIAQCEPRRAEPRRGLVDEVLGGR
ncbi:MAG: aspartate/glutamate racemase family protein [Myxococcota bacterium]